MIIKLNKVYNNHKVIIILCSVYCKKAIISILHYGYYSIYYDRKGTKNLGAQTFYNVLIELVFLSDLPVPMLKVKLCFPVLAI